MQFATHSFIAISQAIVFNSGLYYFSNICAHLNWESDRRVTMQNILLIRVGIKLKSVMLFSGVPKTFPFSQFATITHN